MNRTQTFLPCEMLGHCWRIQSLLKNFKTQKLFYFVMKQFVESHVIRFNQSQLLFSE